MAKKHKVSPGTWIERETFESKAFLALSGFAPQLFILILGKRNFRMLGKKGHEKRVCTNCDSLSFTYTEAGKKYGITIPRLFRAFDELLAKGFIKVKYHGGACQGDKSIYELSETWRLWRPGIVFETRHKEDIGRGFRKPKNKSAHTKP